MNNLLAIIPGDGGSVMGQPQSTNNFYFDNAGEPFLYALIGFVIVFIGILLIIGIIWLVGLIMRKTDNLEFLTKKRGKKHEAKSVQEAVRPESSAVSDDIPDEVKAAIIAAIMAYYRDKEEKCQFTVKRIKRI